MANFRLSYQVKDASEVQKSGQFYGYAPGELQVATAIGDMYTLASLFVPLIAGQILHGWLSFYVNLSDPTVFPAAQAGSDCENTGLIKMYNAYQTNVNPYPIVLPAANKDKFPNNALNLADTDVAALVAFLASPPDGMQFYDKTNGNWGVVTGGKLTMRNNRRNVRNRR